MDAADTFRVDSDAYSRRRPRYPDALFDWLAAGCARRELAWDCATGNGQAATSLAPRFRRVHATDRSREQLASAPPIANVRYAAEPAEATSLADSSVDLVTVAQALHWFDYARFWPEVARVTREGALVAAWGYSWPVVAPDLVAALVTPVRELVAPFWAPENRLLWDGFPDEVVHFPFRRLHAPAFAIEVTWGLPDVVAYLETWSATKRARADARCARALDERMRSAARQLDPDAIWAVRMPLALLVGRVER